MSVRRVFVAAMSAALSLGSAAQALDKAEARRPAGLSVPLEIARLAGPGPHPPVLYIHAKRGFEDEDRRHLRELAAQGFLVVAPD